MNVLCINTAFQTANLAVSSEEGEELVTLTEKHSETTLPSIEKMLENLKLAPKDLDCICINITIMIIVYFELIKLSHYICFMFHKLLIIREHKLF